MDLTPRVIESALYYYRARTYDPKVGRFLQTDPEEPRPKDMTAYVYVMNNPVKLTDPFGLLCRNNSNEWVWVKPEGARPVKLAPHDFFNGNIDGAQPPALGGDWYKVKGNEYATTNLTINEDGTATRSGPGKIVPEVCDDGTKESDWWPGRKYEPAFSDRNKGWKAP